MSLILDGTNGVSDIDGSAATPAIRGTDANTGMFFPAADTIAFSEGGVESMRLNSSGTLVTTNDATISGLTVGKGGGAVASNTVVGLAMNATATGGGNAAFGYGALYVNTTGSENTAVGDAPLRFNTTGANNTAIGSNALNSNTTASYNTAVGYQAGYTNTVATHNTFIGWQAGYSYSGTGGAYNTFVGAQAGQNQTSGQYNTYVGLQAGYLMTTGTRSTIIGGYSGNQGGLDIRTASNYIVLSDGDGNPRLYYDNATGTWTTSGNISFNNSNVIANTSYNNGSANEVVGTPYHPIMVKITVSGAGYTYLQYMPNSGTGVAWQGTLFNPGNGAWTYGTGPSVTFSTAGVNSCNFTCFVNSGSGAFTIQRNSGSVLYNVQVFRLANF